jgi:hypothetical protein
VFNLLSHYCSSLPNLTSSVRVGKINYAVGFFTRSLPCFTNLHSLFYPLGIKIIPSNIYELLTPIALAHLIMGDGSPYKKTGITICTDSYTIQDVVLLINVLIIRYNPVMEGKVELLILCKLNQGAMEVKLFKDNSIMERKPLLKIKGINFFPSIKIIRYNFSSSICRKFSTFTRGLLSSINP